MKYRKSLTSILSVKEAEKRQSGISSFDSLDIELSFRAIRFSLPLEETPILKFQYLQYFCHFLLNFSYILIKITPGFLWDIAETAAKVKTRYGLMTLRSI